MDGDAQAEGSTSIGGSPDRRASSRRDQDLLAPAPGHLELVRSFLALHDHAPGVEASLPPTGPTVARWARGSGLVEPDEEIADGDLVWALEIRDALRTKVHEHAGAPRDHDAIEFLNHAAEDTGLQMCFGCDENRLHTDVEGLRGAIGRVLGIAFLAELDGSFHRLRECQDPTCTSVFFDRSKNHSGKWCSMASCGNRNKVRKFRERERAAKTSEAVGPGSAAR
jgi:predicted RNA-binding Zn ribbon-like protein